MDLRWALPIMAVVLPLQVAHAQFVGMPGPSAGFPDAAGPGFGAPPSAPPPGVAGPGFGAPPSAPPPACQAVLKLRDETQKRGLALQEAGQRKAGPAEACKLFKAFVATETRFIKALEQNMTTCGVPPDVPKRLKVEHAKASQIAARVCQAAAQGPRPTGPSLSDALGTGGVPTAGGSSGRGTFDTLTGNPLAR